MRKLGSLPTKRPASVVLPAPDGEDKTSSRPRRRIGACPACWPVSLNVLHLLAHLIDHRLELQAGARRLLVIGFGAQGVGLAVQFLCQKIQPPSGRPPR